MGNQKGGDDPRSMSRPATRFEPGRIAQHHPQFSLRNWQVERLGAPGLEPGRPRPSDFKSDASTNSATPPHSAPETEASEPAPPGA